MQKDSEETKPEPEPEPEDKAKVILTGTVEKIIPGIGTAAPELAEIRVDEADELYREIRVENTLTDKDGNPVSLKKGAEVEVKIEADPSDVKPKE